MYQVMLLNDDYTPMDFVVTVLQHFFSMDLDKATQVMLHVHTRGRGVCGVFTREVAESKVAQVNEFSRMNQHPLRCTMEKTSGGPLARASTACARDPHCSTHNDIRPSAAGVSLRRTCCEARLGGPAMAAVPRPSPRQHPSAATSSADRDSAITAKLPFRGRKIVHDGGSSNGRSDQASANAI